MLHTYVNHQKNKPSMAQTNLNISAEFIKVSFCTHLIVFEFLNKIIFLHTAVTACYSISQNSILYMHLILKEACEYSFSNKIVLHYAACLLRITLKLGSLVLQLLSCIQMSLQLSVIQICERKTSYHRKESFQNYGQSSTGLTLSNAKLPEVQSTLN